MSEMFKNYPQPEDYVPNNRPHCCKHKGLDIMTGETAEHSFEVPFNVDESCDYTEVIYKLGLTPVIVKKYTDVEHFVTDYGTTVIKCVLNNNETLIFANTLLDTSVQLRFHMKNNTISYSEIYKVNVKDSLDASRIQPTPPGPGILGGLGYTED